MATVAVAFHTNFKYVWLRLLERLLPGRVLRAVLAKVLCDQALSGPVYISACYFGMSILQKKDDIFLDFRQKFWNTYKSSLMYWPFVQHQSADSRSKKNYNPAACGTKTTFTERHTRWKGRGLCTR